MPGRGRAGEIGPVAVDLLPSLRRQARVLHGGVREGVDALLGAVTEAAEGAADPQARVEAGIEALLSGLTGDPAMAQVALVEIRTAGPEGQERYEVASKRFASLLRTGGCLSPGLPGTETERAERTVDSVATVLWMEVGAGHTEKLPRLSEALVTFVMR